MSNYYTKQIDKIVDLEVVNIQISDYSGNKTNNITLNKESIEALKELFEKILKKESES